LQELPALVVAEQVGGFLAGDDGDGELAGLRAAGLQPPVDVVLAQFAQCQFLLIEPGQQVQGDQDPAAQVTAGRSREAADGGAAAGPAQQEPVQERAASSTLLGLE
jgi:hypothetical protein